MIRQFAAWLVNIQSGDEDTQRRGATLVVITVGLQIMALYGVLQPFLDPAPATNVQSFTSAVVSGMSLVLYAVLVVLARRGHVTLSGCVLVFSLTAAVLAVVADGGTISVTPFFLVLPLLVTSLVLQPWYVWLVLAINSFGLGILLSLFPGSTWDDAVHLRALLGTIFLLALTGLISFLGARSISMAFIRARAARQALEQSNVTLEHRVAERTTALQHALRDGENRTLELERLLTEQSRLLAENAQQRQVIRELSVPVLPVSRSTLVMPLVGALDTLRLQDVQQQALTAIERVAAKRLLLDITGVPVVDTQVARGLLDVVHGARLLGAEVALVGVRPEVAQTVVTLGLDLRDVRAFADVQGALS